MDDTPGEYNIRFLLLMTFLCLVVAVATCQHNARRADQAAYDSYSDYRHDLPNPYESDQQGD